MLNPDTWQGGRYYIGMAENDDTVKLYTSASVNGADT